MQTAFSIPSYHATNKSESVRIRRTQKKREWEAEIATLRAAKAKRDTDAAEARRPLLKDERLISLLRSDSFATWFEEITAMDAEKFVERICNVQPEILTLMRTTLDKVVRERVFRVLNAHRWNRPGYRKYWAREIINCTSAAKRRSIILRLATPKGADPLKMAMIYNERDRIQAETGVPHHVDHTVPIQGALVCGLNWEGNMRIVPASVNIVKSNHFVVA
jgi:hypothetical protein